MTHLSPAQAAVRRKRFAELRHDVCARRVFLGDQTPQAIARFWRAERKLRAAMDTLDRACRVHWRQ